MNKYTYIGLGSFAFALIASAATHPAALRQLATTISGTENNGAAASAIVSTAQASTSAPLTITVDNTSGTVIKTKGWLPSKTIAGFYGTDYAYNCSGNSGDFTFPLPISQDGQYDVYLNYTANANRDAKVPVTVVSQNASSTIYLDQRSGGVWRQLGTYTFSKTGPSRVSVGTKGIRTCAIADAVKAVLRGTVATSTKPAPEPIATSTPTRSPSTTCINDSTSTSCQWRLTFSDEFSGSKLNTATWKDSYYHGRYFTATDKTWYAPYSYEVKDGMLSLVANRLPAPFSTTTKYGKQDFLYSSAFLTTDSMFSQKYGYFEAKVKLPKGVGLWPAFWLLPEDRSWPPEIDIFEGKGFQSNNLYFTNHWGTRDNHQMKGSVYSGPDFTAGYHIVAVEWDKDSIKWYVDGSLKFTETGHSPQVPMYVIFDLAVGNGFAGEPDSTTPFPSKLSVDWVRAWQHK